MLKVEGLNAGYGSVNILWDIGFEVKDGEIVAILGSNGAGKTTMVRTITGMVKASSGKVEFNGEDLSGKSSRVILDSGIVQVPEGRQLFTEMTVLENLELGAFNKETKAHFAENLEKCYNWFPKLRERAKQAAGTLSGGEQQMVAVARALIGMPKLLILDEPSLGLAPNIVDDILEVAKTMVKNDASRCCWWSRISPKPLQRLTAAMLLRMAAWHWKAPPPSFRQTSTSRRRTSASDFGNWMSGGHYFTRCGGASRINKLFFTNRIGGQL